MRKMKRIIAIVLLTFLLFALTGCEKSPEEKIQEAFENVDQADVDRLRGMFSDAQASMNGDSYCKNCKKYTEGKVRICPYCGQYI